MTPPLRKRHSQVTRNLKIPIVSLFKKCLLKDLLQLFILKFFI
jgi:hypothetical protein